MKMMTVERQLETRSSYIEIVIIWAKRANNSLHWLGNGLAFAEHNSIENATKNVITPVQPSEIRN